MNIEQKLRLQPQLLAGRAQVFAALGDPARLAMVEMLREQDLPPHSFGEALDLTSNLVAHHLRVLEDAQLVQRRRSQGDARRSYVSLRVGALEHLFAPRASIKARRVVFVCTENSARSILAEAIWREVSKVPVTSAGTRPASKINPRTRTAARKSHLTIVRDAPQPLAGLINDQDLVVSVCDAVRETLPALPNLQLHWSVPDPAAAQTDAAFTAAVTELTERVKVLAPLVKNS